MAGAIGNQSAAGGTARRRGDSPLSRAARFAVEALERRCLLSAGNLSAAQSAILAAVPAGMHGQFDGSQLELSPAPATNAATPDYVLVDASPSLTGTGTLAPYASSMPVGLSPARLRHAYAIDNIKFGSVTGDGTGQTIAIIDAYDDPTAAADLHAFDLQFGLPDPPSFTKVSQTGGSTLPGTDPSPKGNDWEVEESLDIEWAHAVAPQATLILVEANSAYNPDLITAAVGWARSAPGVTAVSMSFGEGEFSGETANDSVFTTPRGHVGVTFLASTGDYGSPGGYPAYSPNVVAVGGTTLNTDSSGNYLSETGWSGSGGGISAYETQPAFQKGVVTQSSADRTVPDVASDADPSTGVPVYDSYDFGSSTPWLQVGGTSLSAPTWAGLVAIGDQGRVLGGAGPLDGPTQTLPRLYSMAAPNFHDITAGSNGLSAGAGYDLVTGRGSPIADTLLRTLGASGPSISSFAPTGLQSTAPSHVDFTFSTPMDPTSFSAVSDVDAFTGPGNADLRSSITDFAWLNNNTTLEVDFAAPAVQGPYTIAIGPQVLSAGGTAMDQNQNGMAGEMPADEFSGTFYFDNAPTQVVSTNPPAGSTLTTSFTVLDLHLSAAYDPTTVGPKNLSISEGSVTAATAVNATTVEYALSGVYGGTVTVAMAQGALMDTHDNPVLAFNASYTVPNTNPPFAGWQTYQGDDGHTGYVNGRQNPTYEQTLWSTKLPSGSLTDMSVGGGAVYVSSSLYFGSATPPSLFALNSATGAINWDIALGSNFSTNAPAFADGNLFVQTDNETTGTYIWSFNAATGAQNFKTPLGAQWENYLTPTVAYGNVYMDGGTYGGMYSVSETTGAQNWFGFVPQYDQWTPAVTSAYCYTFTGSGDTTPITGKFTILNRLTGATVSVTTDTGFYWNGYSMGEAVALGGENDAFATNGNRVLCFNTQASGGINWVATDKFTGQVTVANGVLYVQDGSGIAALSESTGATLWTWTPTNDTLSGRIIATDNMLFASSATTTYAISLKTQQTAWTVAQGGHLALDHNTLYVAGSDGTMTAVGLRTLAAGPAVTSFAPSGLETTAPSSIDFDFNSAMDPTSFSVGDDVDAFSGPGNTDLRSSITGFAWLNNNTTLEVDFAAPTAAGPYTMIIGPQVLSAGGAAMDQNQNGLAGETPADAFSGTFYFDTAPIQVTSTNPVVGSTVTPPFTTVDVRFSKAYDPNTIAPSDFVLSQGKVAAATPIDATTVRYTFTGIATVGAFTISMPQGAIMDTNGVPNLAYSGTYIIAPPAAPTGAPQLAAASDTGISSSDGITKLDNSSPSKTLQFSVAGTLPGYLVSIYADGIFIGSAIAPASSSQTTTTTIVTNGTTALSYGPHSITARQGATGGQSSDSPASSITVLNVAPKLPSAGAYDPSFDLTGVNVDAQLTGYGAKAEMILPSGEVLVAGAADAPGRTNTSATLARYTSDGQLDPTFGTNGYVITPISSGDEIGRSIALQADGKIVVLVTALVSPTFSTIEVVRYNADGSLDPTFGTGGIATLPAVGSVAASQMVIQPDGKLVIAGSNNSFQGELIRLTPGGALDTTFNGKGYLVSNFGGHTDYTAVAVTGDGHIVVGGELSPGGSYIVMLARYTSSGTVDSTFNGTGYVITQVGATYSDTWGIALQPDGKIVVSATAGSGMALLRYTPGGTLDPTFGTGGIVTMYGLEPFAPAIQSDGKIVLGGLYNDYHGFVERFNANGSFDASFGSGGLVVTLIGTPTNFNYFNAVAVQGDGRIVAVGISHDPANPGASEWTVARFLGATASLTLDPSSDSGISNADRITNITTPTFDLPSLPGLYTRVYRNGSLASDPYLTGGTVTLGTQPAGSDSFTLTVVDAAGNESQATAAVAVAIDVTPPTASLDPGAGISPSATGYTFTVTYTDTNGVVGSSLATGNILVTNATGFSQLATLVSKSPSSPTATTMVATYQILPPADGWGPVGKVYTLALQPNSVIDAAGNASVAAVLGSVQAIVVDPPGLPQLQPATDSGMSGSDGVTNMNNSSAAKVLQFLVPNTAPGLTVTVYVDGLAIGTAIAPYNATSTLVTSNGTLLIADGAHVITARQTTAEGQTVDSVPLTIIVDTAGPVTALAGPLLAAGANYQFTLRYTDATAVNVATLDGNDLLVTTSAGFNLLATLVSVSSAVNGTSIVATYQIAPPAGVPWWVAGSTCTVKVQPLQVADTAGNYVSGAVIGSLLLTAPAAPARPVLAAASDSGSSASDGITNFNNSSPARALTFTIYNTTSGDTVIVYVDGAAIGSAVATSSATTITTDGSTALADGVHSITARRAPVGSIYSNPSLALSVTIETAALVPSATFLDPSTDSGASNNDGVTNVPVPTIDVTTKEAGTIHLQIDGPTGPIRLVQASGAGTVSIPAGGALPQGTHTLTAWETDLAGNDSGPTAITSIIIDQTPPTASSFIGPALTTPATTQHTFMVTYGDNVAVNGGSLDSNDILVTGPNGYSQLAPLLSATPNADGSSITATYEVASPAGGWTPAANGTYAATLRLSQISDTAGNFAVSSALGTFGISVAAITLTAPGPNPSDPNQTLTFTATLAGGVADGETVTLVDTSNNNAAVAAGTLAGGSATLTVPAGTLAVGTHNLIAAFGGDGNFAASQSAAYAQVIQAAPPTLVGAPVVNGDDPNGLFTAAGQPANGKQRSMVEDIVYTFNEPVTIPDANAAFTVLVAGPGGGVVPTSLFAQAVAGSNGTQWAVSLTGQPVGTLASIANGEYSIQVNPAGVFSAADGTTAMAAGTGRTDTFFRLFGDIDGNESVSTLDYGRFKQALAGAYNPAFDYDGSGTISTLDYGRFKQDMPISYFGDGFVTTI
jgi:uncharacterized delta-60 repeat protein